MSEKILNVDYESEMGQSYVDYSMSVNITHMETVQSMKVL